MADLLNQLTALTNQYWRRCAALCVAMYMTDHALTQAVKFGRTHLDQPGLALFETARILVVHVVLAVLVWTWARQADRTTTARGCGS